MIKEQLEGLKALHGEPSPADQMRELLAEAANRNAQAILELRESLETIRGHRADFVITTRRRLYQAVELIDAGHPDQDRTDTCWWQRAAHLSDAVAFTKGRMKLTDAAGRRASPMRGQTLFYYGADAERFIQVFSGPRYSARMRRSAA